METLKAGKYIIMMCTIVVSKEFLPLMLASPLTPLCSCLDDNWSFSLIFRLLKRLLLQQQDRNVSLTILNVVEKSRE